MVSKMGLVVRSVPEELEELEELEEQYD